MRFDRDGFDNRPAEFSRAVARPVRGTGAAGERVHARGQAAGRKVARVLLDGSRARGDCPPDSDSDQHRLPDLPETIRRQVDTQGIVLFARTTGASGA